MAFKNTNQIEEGTDEDFQQGKKDYDNGATFDVFQSRKWQEGWYYQYDFHTTSDLHIYGYDD